MKIRTFVPSLHTKQNYNELTALGMKAKLHKLSSVFSNALNVLYPIGPKLLLVKQIASLLEKCCKGETYYLPAPR